MIVFRPIRGFPGYAVSISGRVWSYLTDKELKATPNRDGYLHVSLYNNGRRSTAKIHTLVCTVFHGPRPPGRPQLHPACHIDGNRLNNHKDNLRWATPSDNWHDGLRNGKTNAKLRPSSAKYVRSSNKRGVDLAKELGVSPQTICDVRKGRIWSHV